MPRKARSNKRKPPAGLSKESVQKIGAIAKKTEEETFEDLINDFDIQAEKLKRQIKRMFASDCKKMLQYLPQKSSMPREILKMSAYEFKERGGTLGAVLESLKSGKMPGESQQLTVDHTVAANKENAVGTSDPLYVTPAFSTRSKAVTAGATENTLKRKPNPLEQVALSAHATDSGSPVDENMFIKLKLGQAVEDFESQLLEATTSFPQKWRSQLQKKLRQARLQVKTQMEEQCFQTPALIR